MYVCGLSNTEPAFVNLLWSPGFDSQPGGPVRQPYLTYRPARLHRLAESIPWNLFLSSLNVCKFGLCRVRRHRLAETIPWNRFLCSLKVYKFGLSSYMNIQCIYCCTTPAAPTTLRLLLIYLKLSQFSTIWRAFGALTFLWTQRRRGNAAWASFTVNTLRIII